MERKIERDMALWQVTGSVEMMRTNRNEAVTSNSFSVVSLAELLHASTFPAGELTYHLAAGKAVKTRNQKPTSASNSCSTTNAI
jgi:hypothetical protein